MIPQLPWFERRFDLSFPVHLFPVIFSRLEGALFRLHSILVSADDDKCSYQLDGWSVKQHLGHLADLEELWWQRLLDMQHQKEIMTEADLTNNKTEQANHNENTLENLMQAFVLKRQKMLEFVYDMDETSLSLTSIHPRLNIPFRVIDLLYFVAEHDDHHIAAISSFLRKPTG